MLAHQRINWCRSFLAAALLLGAGCVTTAHAVPITSDDGIVGSFTLSAVGSSGWVTLTLDNNTTAVSQLNGTSLGGFANWIPTTFSPAGIQIGANGQPTINFTLLKTLGPLGVDLANNPVTGSAVFEATLNVATLSGNTLTIQGNESLQSTTSSLDLSQFGVGSLIFTFNTPNPGEIQGIFTHAASGNPNVTLQETGSGSFSQSNVPFGVVPEPASIAIWSLLGVGCAAGLGWYRRRRQQSRV